MNKTASIVMSLRPNQGWWLTLFLNEEHNGTLNTFPYPDKTTARGAAECFAAIYKGNGYEASIREGGTLH